MKDEKTPVPGGTKGTVKYVDDLGTIHYNIDFSEANSDEREFVLKMANKSMDLVTR